MTWCFCGMKLDILLAKIGKIGKLRLEAIDKAGVNVVPRFYPYVDAEEEDLGGYVRQQVRMCSRYHSKSLGPSM